MAQYRKRQANCMGVGSSRSRWCSQNFFSRVKKLRIKWFNRDGIGGVGESGMRVTQKARVVWNVCGVSVATGEVAFGDQESQKARGPQRLQNL